MRIMIAMKMIMMTRKRRKSSTQRKRRTKHTNPKSLQRPFSPKVERTRKSMTSLTKGTKNVGVRPCATCWPKTESRYEK